MADQQQRDIGDAEVPKAPVDADRIWAGIDDDRGMRRCRQHERVTLPDVACDECPPGRRPGRHHVPDRNLHDHGNQPSDEQQASMPRPAGHPHQRGDERGQSQPAADA